MNANDAEPSAESRFARRTVLGGIASVALVSGTGCIEMGGSGATDVYVTNNTDKTRRVTLIVGPTDSDHVQIDATHAITPDEHWNPTAQDKITWGGTYTVSVSVKNGPSATYTWRDPHDPLYVSLGTKEVSFETMAGTPTGWNESE
ncbi:hypothetical protein U3A55_06695 [Salarchaeum sp. III]|uniref:hypothetical protein n=1 Tax=Salarchaeum sp. III TaxID=3107927 RepID=UPI002ED8D4E4